MEPAGNHMTAPYGTPACPPMYPNTDYNIQQKMQDQYYNDRGGYPGLAQPQPGQTYPAMAMEQSKMADPSFAGGYGGGRSTGPDLGPMMRALTEDDLFNQQQQQQAQQAQYRQQQLAGMAGYGQNMNYPATQETMPPGYHAAGQYPFSPGHSPRNAQFFPMHGQAAAPTHDGYTSPPVQNPHFGPNGPYQRQSPLMNMGSPNGQPSPNIPPFAGRAPVTSPSPVMGMQGNNGMYNQSHNNSGHLSHNSPLPSPSNLRSPASVHSPKSLPSPNTFASPSPSPVGSLVGQSHRQTRSPGIGGPFQQNQVAQPYPIPSPKVRAVEQASSNTGSTPYVELVSTRDSPAGSVASSNSQESVGKAPPYQQREQSSSRGHLPQLEEMVKFLGEPTAKGILPLGDDSNVSNQSKLEENCVNNCIEEKVNNLTESNSSNMSVGTPAFDTSNGPKDHPNACAQGDIQQHPDLLDSKNNVNNTLNGPPGQKSPRRRNNSKSPKRENHTGSPTSQSAKQDSDDNSQEVTRRRRTSNQRSPKRRNSEGTNESVSPRNKSPRRHSLDNPNIKEESEPNSNEQGDNPADNPASEETRTDGENNPGAKSDDCDIDSKVAQNENSDGVKRENAPDKPQDELEVKTEFSAMSPHDIPSTSRPVTPFKNPMTTPTSKRQTPESAYSSDASSPRGKRKGRPVGSKNRTKEEIEKEKVMKKEGVKPKRAYRRRNINPEMKSELDKFKHVPKGSGSKIADSKVSLRKGPVLRLEGTQDNVISSKILNCPEDEQSRSNIVGKKQKKKTGKLAKRFSSMSRVPHGPSTMYASDFRPVGEWVCGLCGKTANVGTLGHLYGPYYPHGYQIPPMPPKTDSTTETKDIEIVEVVEKPSAQKGRGKGTKARLKSKSPPPPPKGKGRAKRGGKTPQAGRLAKDSKGASGKRQSKAAKMEDFDYEYDHTPVATKRRRRSSSSSKTPASASAQQEPAGKRRRVSLKDDPSRPDPNEIWVHEDCAIWAQGVYAMGSTLYGLYEAVLAAKKVECVRCSKKGASMGCLSKGCKNTYHFMCAQQAGCQFQEENYSMICPEHKDKMVKMRDVT